MDNQEIRELIIKEIGIEGLPEDAQNEIIGKLGEIALKSLTITIFEKLPKEARAEFEEVSAEGDYELVQKFLAQHVPDLPALMADEVRKTLQDFKEQE